MRTVIASSPDVVWGHRAPRRPGRSHRRPNPLIRLLARGRETQARPVEARPTATAVARNA